MITAKLISVALALFCVLAKENTFVHPISIENRHFVDSITHERFQIQGVDYQPGGSAAYTGTSDPLSDRDKCARDIYLMQELGINTVRVYTVNPDLNHDDCMTMLAASGIYLVLDVNSPLYAESINRYEPWTTYTPDYLKHVFKVVDQFSRYNNTMAFFVGNEIVNDENSAAVSPPYIRAVTRDVKNYMSSNCPRLIPLGYSAADDLKYRTQLPHYLTCGDSNTAIDFYGVNSYQWCGNQTIESSGYDVLIEDHKNLKFPVFFSEYGCNHIQPRLFQEVEAIYSSAMTPYFDGGLVYEFSQETNDYGLVTFSSQGSAYLREDFYTLKTQFAKNNVRDDTMRTTSLSSATDNGFSVNPASALTITFPRSQLFARANSAEKSTQAEAQLTECRPYYSNLKGAALKLPDSFGTDMIRNGVNVNKGNYNSDLLKNMPQSPYQVFDLSGREILRPRIKVVNDFSAHILESSWQSRKDVSTSFSQGFKQLASQAFKAEKAKEKKNANEGRKNRVVVTFSVFAVVALIALIL